ncbi:hypothetical protein SKAU_G00332830 [Synaphobranchus kaupii]|uniref:Uncharacterized protein n=1 Tax=Synaphobranchus kaupii TaxID=118154 RepID=A0A9Q1ELH9_SYNKA|nr:hypothetical protein SKAU_G00332830 [Synaphobranchus kaupii]
MLSSARGLRGRYPGGQERRAGHRPVPKEVGGGDGVLELILILTTGLRPIPRLYRDSTCPPQLSNCPAPQSYFSRDCKYRSGKTSEAAENGPVSIASHQPVISAGTTFSRKRRRFPPPAITEQARDGRGPVGVVKVSAARDRLSRDSDSASYPPTRRDPA